MVSGGQDLGLKIGVLVGAGGGDVGADDGACQAGTGFDVSVGPEEGVLQNRPRFDESMGADDVVAEEGGGGVDLGEGVDGGGTKGGGSVGEVGVKVGGAVAEVPPGALIEHESADTVTAFNQAEENGDDGLFFAGSEPVKEGRTDHVNASEEIGTVIPSAEFAVDVGDEAGGEV